MDRGERRRIVTTDEMKEELLQKVLQIKQGLQRELTVEDALILILLLEERIAVLETKTSKK